MSEYTDEQVKEENNLYWIEYIGNNRSLPRGNRQAASRFVVAKNIGELYEKYGKDLKSVTLEQKGI